ncbi:hypothetical protein PSEUBRA_005165 [Kalmanozyma brasiliensis GHG001]|uniref:uncharacterized protein n=1 Tax=Kalmanozyma brasiliensis (strain GHG001) TaxID=1365824 RepID=UPI002867CAF1|nr:uncharacterized protein PSEUBRA_005165 [Kalmanozyma brasiliensis GHG001]KAF6767487.1 hypothetical protein PSEUBRA_005165 [Kalmanozyma brasiliensis GHG001]
MAHKDALAISRLLAVQTPENLDLLIDIAGDPSRLGFLADHLRSLAGDGRAPASALVPLSSGSSARAIALAPQDGHEHQPFRQLAANSDGPIFLGRTGISDEDYVSPAFFRTVCGSVDEPTYLKMVLMILKTDKLDIRIGNSWARRLTVDMGDGVRTGLVAEKGSVLYDSKDSYPDGTLIAAEDIEGFIKRGEQSLFFDKQAKALLFPDEIRPPWQVVQAWHSLIDRKRKRAKLMMVPARHVDA